MSSVNDCGEHCEVKIRVFLLSVCQTNNTPGLDPNVALPAVVGRRVTIVCKVQTHYIQSQGSSSTTRFGCFRSPVCSESVLRRCYYSVCGSLRAGTIILCAALLCRSENTKGRSKKRLPSFLVLAIFILFFCQVTLEDVARATAEVLSHLLSRGGSGKTETETKAWAQSQARNVSERPCLACCYVIQGTGSIWRAIVHPLSVPRGDADARSLSRNASRGSSPHPPASSSATPQCHMAHGKYTYYMKGLS